MRLEEGSAAVVVQDMERPKHSGKTISMNRMRIFSVSLNAFSLGIATIIPTIYVIVFFLELTAAMLGFWQPSEKHLRQQFVIFGGLGVWTLALGIFYVRHYLRNERIPYDKRTLRRALSLLGNLYEMPRYWYTYVAGDLGADPSSNQDQSGP